MIPKLALSITGFIPLYVLMIFTYVYCYLFKNKSYIIKEYILITVALIVCINIVCIIIVLFYIKSKENGNVSENTIQFSNIKENKKAHVDYMMTYLLPLLTFNVDSIQGFNILYTNLLILFFIYMNARGENFSLNIVLSLKGYRIYTGENINSEKKVLLIKKKKFSNIKENNSKYEFVKLAGSNDIYLCKKYL